MRDCYTLGCPRDLLQRLFQFLGLEPKWPGLALVNHAVVMVDQVDALRPSRVGALGRVVKSIDDRGKLDTQLANARSRDLAAFLIIFWTCEKNFVLEVALRLPDVGGMRLESCTVADLSSVARLKSGARSPACRCPARARVHIVSNGTRKYVTSGVRCITRPNFPESDTWPTRCSGRVRHRGSPAQFQRGRDASS